MELTDKKVSVLAAAFVSVIITFVLSIGVLIVLSAVFPKRHYLIYTAVIAVVALFNFTFYLLKEMREDEELKKKLESDLKTFVAETGANPLVELDVATYKMRFDVDDSTTFKAIINAGIVGLENTAVTTIRLQFPISARRENFYIEQKGVFFPNRKAFFSSTPNCQKASFPVLDDKFHFNCTNPNLLSAMLNEPKIIAGLSELHQQKPESLRTYLENDEFFVDCELWTGKGQKEINSKALQMLKLITHYSIDCYRRFKELRLSSI